MKRLVLWIMFVATMVLSLAVGHARILKFSLVEAERAAGQQLFAEHCTACHGRAGVAAGYGPSLIGVVGRQAGSLAGFPYSPALKNAGIVWSEDNLVKWIAGAPAMVPGTKMPHVSIADPAERLYLREYLKTLSPPH